MTKGWRGVVIATSAGLLVGLGGFAALNENSDLNQASSVPSRATSTPQPGADATTRAASSVPSLDERATHLAAAQDLLAARSRAVKIRSKKAWMATVDSTGAAFRSRQSTVFDNLVKLPLGTFSYGTVRIGPGLSSERRQQVGPGAWAATVSGSYRLAGFDRAPQSFVATYTLVQRPGGWRIADDIDDIDGATPLQMWDLPGLKVLRGTSGIVIGNAPEARMRDYKAIVDSAVRRVSGVWGSGWSTQVVVVTPSTAEEFAGLLSRSAGDGLDQVAAITQGVIDPGMRAQGDRVVINPNTFTALQPLGRRVVITHELTHVAVRSSTTGTVPIWLAEGLADYIGYSGLDLPRERVSGELLTLVRAGKGPKALPGDIDFDPSQTKIAPSYTGAWLAVSRLVDRSGQAKVVAFYRGVAVAPAPGRAQPSADARAASAFPRSFGVTQSKFVADWRRYLGALADAGG